MRVSYRTFSINKALYTAFVKYSRTIGTSLVLSLMIGFFHFFGSLCNSFNNGGFPIIKQLGLMRDYGLLWQWFDVALQYTSGAIKSIFAVEWIIAIFMGLTLLSSVVMIGLQKMFFDLYRTESARFSSLFSYVSMGIKIGVLQMLGVSIFAVPLIVLSTVFGTCLVAVPLVGVLLFITVRSQFVILFMIDRRLGILEALDASWSATHGNIGKLMMVMVAGGLVSFLLPIVAWPFVWFVHVYIYGVLSGRDSEGEVISPVQA